MAAWRMAVISLVASSLSRPVPVSRRLTGRRRRRGWPTVGGCGVRRRSRGGRRWRAVDVVSVEFDGSPERMTFEVRVDDAGWPGKVQVIVSPEFDR